MLEGQETQEPADGEPGDGEQTPRESTGPRMTTRYLTKYEKARVLGTRALQIRYFSNVVEAMYLAINEGLYNYGQM